MTTPSLRVRTAARALIIRDDKLLLIHYRGTKAEWYGLPGGGQQHGESLHDAVLRECQEEIGATVTVGPLRFIREYIGKNHQFAPSDSHFHQVDFIFAFTIVGEYAAAPGVAPDTRQIGVAWIPLADLPKYRLFPAVLKHLADPVQSAALPVYLGDVN